MDALILELNANIKVFSINGLAPRDNAMGLECGLAEWNVDLDITALFNLRIGNKAEPPLADISQATALVFLSNRGIKRVANGDVRGVTNILT